MDDRDPFAAAPRLVNHRFTHFDSKLFALTPGVSADQARRALEAHLAETDRRLEETGKVGEALVQQHKVLTEKLAEVEKLQAEDELTPELKQKLVEIEKDYADVARESARVFLPKSRVSSSENGPASPYSTMRSVSPSKFESHGTGSPTKPSIPNRKIRNQPTNRVHDIEFAAEISTSLIAQVRSLQGLLAEKEEEVRELRTERSQLEVELESIQQRVKTLDESEHRYKDENWNLETQIRELMSSQKDSTDREKKMGQAMAVLNTEKNTVLRELDEAKLALAKLSEDHVAAAKHYDVELGAAKRSIVMAENERNSLQRRLDELAAQNQELAKAFSLHRGRALEREGPENHRSEHEDHEGDNTTPEHSPPPSPVKCTPRHAGLESETLKSSFQHLQRQLQVVRANLHREKTEKLEMRRMLQETRDELERARSNRDSTLSQLNRRSKKIDPKEVKKHRPVHLGAARNSRSEMFMEDPDWEDSPETISQSTPRTLLFGKDARTSTGGISSSTQGFFGSGSVLADSPSAGSPVPPTPPADTDAFETAQETSDAFETANERATASEFETGAENLTGDDTETEAGTRRRSQIFTAARKPSLATSTPFSHRERQYSMRSTASTSGDEEETSPLGAQLRTPSMRPLPHRLRFRASRGNLLHRSRHASEEPTFASPGSVRGSIVGTPHAHQSLFAELGELESESDFGSPSRRSVRSMTPASFNEHTMIAARPKAMADSGTQTDGVDTVAGHFESFGAGVEQSQPTLPVLSISPTLLCVALEPVAELQALPQLVPLPLPLPQLQPVRPSLSLSALLFEAVEPLAEPQPMPPPLSVSATLVCQAVEPVAELQPQPICPTLSVSSMLSETIEPVSEPRLAPPELSVSTLLCESVKPLAQPELALPLLSVSNVLSQEIVPAVEPQPEIPPLSFSTTLLCAEVEPVIEPQPQPVRPALSVSPLLSEAVEPLAEPPLAQPSLSVSTLLCEAMEPLVQPQVALPLLSVSSLLSQEIVPVAEPTMPIISYPDAMAAGIFAASKPTLEPVTRLEASAPVLSVSNILCEAVTPSVERPMVLPVSTISNVLSEEIVPVAERASPSSEVVLSGMRGHLPATAAVMRQPYDNVTNLHAPSPPLSISTVLCETVEPLPESGIARPPLSVSDVLSQEILPVPELATPPSASAVFSMRDYRPGSATTVVRDAVSPLPANDRPVVEAARSTTSSSQGVGSMGPPPIPAHVLRNRAMSPQSPRTPTRRQPDSVTLSDGGDVTPRASNQAHGTAIIHPQGVAAPHAHSRRSSISSFASEIDTRFRMQQNVTVGQHPPVPHGFSPGTDPRMIAAITQTMIGEYLWKYTRKTGSSTMSQTRHRRYFWVHPYTRTLYWSERDPSVPGHRTEGRTKNVQIEAVRVVTDDNPYPPGLYRKSLIVIAPGRSVKFTCPTSQRHDIWHNALQYLLLRTTDGHSETQQVAENFTQEDVDEFNPQYSRRPTNGYRTGFVPSLSSYNSRPSAAAPSVYDTTTSFNPPTLNHHRGVVQRPSLGSLGSKISGYWKSGTLRSRNAGNNLATTPSSIYEASQVHDSFDDGRQYQQQQQQQHEREEYRLENVRACCDGKHDCGTLPHTSRRGLLQAHRLAHNQSPTATNTPMGTLRSRA